jgi:hypothetical protein
MTAYVSPIIDGQVRPECSPYLHKLALLLLAWNDLHQELSQLFAVLSASDEAYNIWHSTDSDSAQRKMLRKVINSGVNRLPRAKQEGPKWAKRAKCDIEDLLNQIDTAMRGQRNDVIHSPYQFELHGTKVKMVPSDFFQSPRAAGLNGDLLAVFSRLQVSFETLAAFAQRVRLCLYLTPQPTWPDKLKLPQLPPKKSLKG